MAPTPCGEWTVRDVVNHLVGMNLVFAALLDSGPTPEPGADYLGQDPLGAYQSSAPALHNAFTRPGVLKRSYAGSLGNATGAERLQIRLYDLLAHGWDLGQATGIPARLPDDLAGRALAFRSGPTFHPAAHRPIRRATTPSTTRPRLSNISPHSWDARSDRNCKAWPSSRSVTARRICAKHCIDGRYGRASKIRLNGVCVAIRNRVKPASSTIHFPQPPLPGLARRAPVLAAPASGTRCRAVVWLVQTSSRAAPSSCATRL